MDGEGVSSKGPMRPGAHGAAAGVQRPTAQGPAQGMGMGAVGGRAPATMPVVPAMYAQMAPMPMAPLYAQGMPPGYAAAQGMPFLVAPGNPPMAHAAAHPPVAQPRPEHMPGGGAPNAAQDAK